MHRHASNYAGDSESLQADVMRFMAIIAFCLIAILALVKNTEPVDPATPEPEPEPVTVVEAPAVEPPVFEAEPEPVVTQPVLPEPVMRAPAVAALEPPPPPEEKVVDPLPTPVARATVPAPAPETPADEASEKAAVARAAAQADAESEEEEEGLTLRFASDGDFLRLIARGDIRVYAFQASDVLALNESYRFLDTAAPGQVYELLPPSIPQLIVDALKQARPDTNGYRWGIALPGRISHQIEQHLDQVSTGELVIDRYGDVHHVAAS